VRGDTDVITSVQGFVDGPELVIELWGSTTVVSPNDERYDDREFQDNTWTSLSDYSWRARRIVYGVTETTHSADEALQFLVTGSSEDISKFRKV
jgi:ribose 1,5-bisphosphokinase PhnN